MPTNSELAHLSDLAYREHLSKGQIIDGWEVVQTRTNEKTGFAGFAFRRVTEAGEEVVVAYRGTDGFDDAKADAQIAAQMQNDQTEDAVNLYREVRE